MALLLLGIDIGTTATKAILVDPEGRVEAEHPLLLGSFLHIRDGRRSLQRSGGRTYALSCPDC